MDSTMAGQVPFWKRHAFTEPSLPEESGVGILLKGSHLAYVRKLRFSGPVHVS